MGISGIALNFAATNVNNQDYDTNISSSNPTNYYNAISIYPSRVEAYEKLIEYYKNHESENADITKVGNVIEAHDADLDTTDPAIADMYYDMGKLYFSNYLGSFKTRAVNAQSFFQIAANSDVSFNKKEIASCYYSICKFMTNQSTTSEHSLADYIELFEEIESAKDIVGRATDSEANYDKISLYYVTMLLINDQAEYMAGVGFDRQGALSLMDEIYQNANGITSTLSYVNDLKDEIKEKFNSYMANINAKYNEVEKRQNGGN